jgi:hypothetical protein
MAQLSRINDAKQMGKSRDPLVNVHTLGLMKVAEGLQTLAVRELAPGEIAPLVNGTSGPARRARARAWHGRRDRGAGTGRARSPRTRLDTGLVGQYLVPYATSVRGDVRSRDASRSG